MNIADRLRIDDGMYQLNIYGIYNLGDVSVGRYIHIETDITQPSSNVMMMIEAVGFNYATGANIRCAWNFYSYSYAVGNTANNSSYPGLTADGIYYTSAGYVAIRGYAASLAYCGFSLNAYPTAGNGARYTVNVRRVSQNSNAGSYY